MKRRNLILLLGGTTSGAMSVGTGAFSSVKAERGVEVSVVGDENAYLGLRKVDDGARVVQVTNQFNGALALTVTVEELDDVVSSVLIDGSEVGDDGTGEVVLDVGEDSYVAVECYETGEHADFTLSFDGEVEQSGTTVEASRTFTITCDEGNLTDELVVQFPGGSGNARISNGIDGEVTVTAYYRNDGGEVVSTKVEDVSEGELISLGEGEEERSIIGIGIEGIGVFRKSDRGDGQKVTEDQAVEEDDAFSDGS